MDLGLGGRLALVTGSTKGIGRAIAAELLAEGAEVIIHGRAASSLAETAELLSTSGKVHTIAADLASAEGVEQLVAAARAIGAVDVVVSNAATYWAAPFGELSDEDWDRALAVNLMATVRISRAFLPQMLEAGWGRIVVVSSDYGVQPNPLLLHYSVSKAAVMSLVRGLAETTRGTAVTVNTVIAGPTWTEGAADFLEASDDGRDLEERKRELFEPGAFLSASLLERYLAPSEVAGLVSYLCSARASCVNGAAQRAEGGVIKAIT